jgi:hypothetical protein
MDSEMNTPRPQIEITEESMSEEEKTKRRNHLKECTLISSVFKAVIDAWRHRHLLQIGKPSDYPNYTEFKRAAEDPDPYDTDYIFYCLKK